MAGILNGIRIDTITCDSTLASASENPLQNKVIYQHLKNNTDLATTSKEVVGAINELNTTKIGRFETMPTASASYADRQIYQYIGLETSDYKHGAFYECLESTETAGTYYWKEVELGGSVAFANITGSPNDNANLASALNQRQLVTNLVTAFQATPDDVHYPSEKLVYDAIENLKQTIYDYAHPVGSTVIGFSAPTVPAGVSATWGVSSAYDGKALWVDSTQTAGTVLSGSLPQIEGQMGLDVYGMAETNTIAVRLRSASGPFSLGDLSDNQRCNNSASSVDVSYQNKVKFKASDANSVYSASAGTNVVRPTSTVVHVYVRTA